MERKIKLKNIVNHFILITKHRWVVFRLCCKIGLYRRGFLHDLSKYSPTEFLEGIRYYNGSHSPITEAKIEKGYSKAWLHHKGRNKHHSEYWIDLNAKEKTPMIPYQFIGEMLCDKLAAGIVYQGENWKKEYQLEYWKKEKEKTLMNEKIKDLLTDFFNQVAINGIDEVLTKKNVKELYKKYCGNS